MTGRELVRFLRELLRQTEWRHDGVTRHTGGWRFQLSIRNVVTGEVVELNCYQPFAVVMAFVEAERYGSPDVRYHNQGGQPA